MPEVTELQVTKKVFSPGLADNRAAKKGGGLDSRLARADKNKSNNGEVLRR